MTTDEKRRAALELANKRRIARKELRQGLKRRRIDLAQALRSPHAAGMRIAVLLEALPGQRGPVKNNQQVRAIGQAAKLAAWAGISPHARVRDLSPIERHRLIRAQDRIPHLVRERPA